LPGTRFESLDQPCANQSKTSSPSRVQSFASSQPRIEWIEHSFNCPYKGNTTSINLSGVLFIWSRAVGRFIQFSSRLADFIWLFKPNMLLKSFTLLCLLALSSICVSQLSRGASSPSTVQYTPPEWDRYPLNPQPYPKYGKPPTDMWPRAIMQNAWKIDTLSLTRLNTKVLPGITTTFNIYRSNWERCVEDIVPMVYVPCGWRTSEHHLNCSSDGNSANKWFSCEQHPYSRCPHEWVEKDMQWIKWRLFDLEEKPSTRAFSQVKMQFVHGVPVLP
jgi:hypothetical protein